MTPYEVRSNYMKQVVYHSKQAELRQLKDAHKTADSKTKYGLTKQIKALEAELEVEKDTFEFVHTISPKKVVERIVGQLEKIREDYKNAMVKFIERVQDNPEDAIAWKGNYMVAQQVQDGYAKLLIDVMNKQQTEDEMITEYIRVYNYIKEEATGQIMINARRGSSRSTSGFHNVVEQARMEGMASFFENWQLGEAEYYLDMINNYKILKEAGLLTEEE